MTFSWDDIIVTRKFKYEHSAKSFNNNIFSWDVRVTGMNSMFQLHSTEYDLSFWE